MKTGENVTDSKGTSWTVGQELGRGACSRSFVARAQTGEERVMQVALEAGDLFGDDAEVLADVCNRVVDERAQWMRERHRSWLPECSAPFSTATGARAVLLPRAGATLAARLHAQSSLASAIEVLITVAEHASSGVHGNLHASNVLLGEDGSVWLADPITPTLEVHRARLEARMPHRPAVLPHEATAGPAQVWDTHAICASLYAAAAAPLPAGDGRKDGPAQLPKEGLDRIALAEVKDRVLTRLQQERANPRFAHRVSEKLGAVLNRGLSRQPQPSPPYRFHKTAELHSRLTDVRDLIDPRVDQVGKVLLASNAKGDVFEGGDPASFSTTVSCTAGVSHEDLAAGLLVRDLDAEGDGRVPVPDAQYSVKPHPSGRLRFDFTLPALRPGRYVVRAAFTVKDSGHEPVTTEGHFEMRPPPGYVPPVDEPTPETSALRFPGSAPATDLTPDPLQQAQYDEGPDDPFPTPIAPSDSGLLSDFQAAPSPHLRAVPTPPPSAVLTNPPGFMPSPVPTSGVPSIAPSAGIPSIAPNVRPPSLHVAPSIAPAGVPSAPGFEPDITARVDTPPPDLAGPPQVESWNNPGNWEQLPSPDGPIPAHVGLDPLLPSAEGMEDLPSIGSHPSGNAGLPDWLERAVSVVRDNTMIALAVTVGGVVALLVLSGLLINSCAG